VKQHEPAGAVSGGAIGALVASVDRVP